MLVSSLKAPWLQFELSAYNQINWQKLILMKMDLTLLDTTRPGIPQYLENVRSYENKEIENRLERVPYWPRLIDRY